MLAYLQLADNPAYTRKLRLRTHLKFTALRLILLRLFPAAFNRVINVPKRAIGDKTVKDIGAAAKEKGISCYELVTRALKGSSVGNIKPGQKANLATFVKTITKVREMATAGAAVSELIDVVVDGINYKDHLERTYGAESLTRLENINELK